MENVAIGGVGLGDWGIADELCWPNQMQEREDHLQPAHPNTFKHGCLLFVVFFINRATQDRVICLCLLKMDAQIDDEAENLIVAMVHWG